MLDKQAAYQTLKLQFDLVRFTKNWVCINNNIINTWSFVGPNCKVLIDVRSSRLPNTQAFKSAVFGLVYITALFILKNALILKKEIFKVSQIVFNILKQGFCACLVLVMSSDFVYLHVNLIYHIIIDNKNHSLSTVWSVFYESSWLFIFYECCKGC